MSYRPGESWLVDSGVQLAGNRERPVGIVAVGSLLLEQVFAIESLKHLAAQASTPILLSTSSVGGGAGNVAVIASRLGCPTSIVSCVSRGRHWLPVADVLDRAQVDMDLLCIREVGDGNILTILTDSSGTWHTLDFLNPALKLGIEDLPTIDDLQRASVVHFDGYSYQSVGTPEVVMEAVRRAKESSCLVSIDAAIPSATADPGFVRRLIGLSSIAFMNEDELLSIAQTSSVDQAIEELRGAVPLLFVKRGSNGSIVATEQDQWSIPPYPTTVVDTLAAGDSYVAAALVALLRGLDPAAAGHRGSAAGALACRHAGSLNGDFDQNDLDVLLEDRPS